MDIVSFILLLALFAGIGLWSLRKSYDSAPDYLLAGRSVSPLLTAMSAAATKYSGYMFIGLIGYIYAHGLSAVWIAVGFFFGDLFAFVLVHKRLRHAADATNAMGIPELLSKWNGGNYRILRLLIGLLILVFLTTYAAAQFTAGGKALQVLFGWQAYMGATIGAGVVMVYCFAGGLRASIWTDAAQSILMLGAMLLLLATAVAASGGVASFFGDLSAVSPNYMDLGVLRFGSAETAVLFAVGWLFNGIGTVGQPHIVIRFMSLDRKAGLTGTAIFYFLWSGLFLILTVLVGLATRLYLTDSGSFDAELALPMMAASALPGFAVGVVIAGVFAASMSTADSQVLSCSAVLSEDFAMGAGPVARRIATVAIAAAALLIGLFGSSSVFALVIFAWSALACSIGPLIILHALGRRPAEWVAIATMATGLIVALAWRETGLNAHVYEGLPGILSAFIAYAMLTPLHLAVVGRRGSQTRGQGS